MHNSIKINKLQHLFTTLLENMYPLQICLPNATYMPYAKLHDVHQLEKYGNIYATYECSDINHVTRSVHTQQGCQQWHLHRCWQQQSQHSGITLNELANSRKHKISLAQKISKMT